MELSELLMENIDCTQKISGNVYYSSCPSKVMDFSGNYNILKPPFALTVAMAKTRFSVKPDLEYKRARANVAGKFGLEAECIAVDKSTHSLLDVILKSLRARSVAMVMPCETVYKDVCRLNGCEILPYVLKERKNFKFDGDDFIEGTSSRADVVIISNPNSVTGRVITRSDMRNILDYCLAKGIYVVLDETFIDFVPDANSGAELVGEYNNLIVIRSLSEYYNMSGVGIAYSIASKEITENIFENQLPWPVDSLGATLCENAYKYPKFDLKTKKSIFEEKRKFIASLKAVNNIKVVHSDCHYLLLKLEDTSATIVYNRLLKSNILIRDASSFTGLDGSYIRVAVKDEKSNNMFIESLLKCLI